MVKETSIAAVVLAMLLTVGINGPVVPARLAKSGVKAGAKNAAAPVLQTTTSTMAQIYGGYWQLDPGHSTTLILHNKDQQNPLTVNVVLFANTGQVISSNGQTVTAQVQLGANGAQQMALASLAPADGALHSGGVAVQYNSTAVGVSGELMITSSNGTSIAVPLSGGYALDTENALYAPWWLGDAGTDGNLELFNSSSQALVVTPAVTVQGVEHAASSITLGAHASQTVSLRSLLDQINGGSATVGSITLRYSGAAHALQPVLVLANNSTGFWMTSGFHAHHNQAAGAAPVTGAGTTTTTGTTLPPAQPAIHWGFADLKLQWSGTTNPLHGYALLSNGTKSPMDVRLEAHFVSTRAKDPVQRVVLPVTPRLAPLETRLVDLSQFVSNGTISGNPSRVGLVASHAGRLGDLAATVFSVNPGSSLAFASPGEALSPSLVDMGYWEVQAKKESPKGVRNPTSTATQGQVILYFPTGHGVGSYEFPVMQLPANSETKITLGKITRVPDVHGVVAPKGTKAGIAVLLPVAAGSTSAAAAPRELCGPSCPAVAAPASVSNLTAETANPVPDSAPVQDVTVIFNQHIHFNQHMNQTCNPPQLDGIQTDTGGDGAEVGTLAHVTLSGQFFPMDPQIVTDDSISVINVQRVSETSITADFDIAYDPMAVGGHDVTVVGEFGESNAVTFNGQQPPPPQVNGLSVNHGQAGQTVQLQISGSDFHDGDMINEPSGVISGTVDSVIDPQTLNATLQIPVNAQAGIYHIQLTDIFGASGGALAGAADFTVDPVPVVIVSVSPPNWTADSSFPLMISGTGFGTSPTLQITDPAGAVSFTSVSGSPTLIQANVVVGPGAPAENATITVTFGGANQAPVVSSKVQLRPQAGTTTQPGIVPKPPSITVQPGTTVNPGIRPKAGSPRVGAPRNQGTVTVGAPRPLLSSGPPSASVDVPITPLVVAITSVSPSLWEAGFDNVPVTITGTGFGHAPSLTISDPNKAITSTPLVVVATDATGAATAIQTNITITGDDGPESATLDVINNDTVGGGVGAPVVLRATATANSTKTGAATVAGAPAPLFFAAPPAKVPVAAKALIASSKDSTVCTNSPKDISKSKQNVVAGQQIALVACITLPDGVTPGDIQSESWSTPTGTVVAGFTNGAAGSTKPDDTGGHKQDFSVSKCGKDTNCVLTPFYWLCPSTSANSKGFCAFPGDASLTFTYTVKVSDGTTQSPVTTAKFSVNGPTISSVTSQFQPAGVIVLTDPVTQLTSPALGLGPDSTTVFGIKITENGAFPSGAAGSGAGGPNANFQWVQLITNLQFTTLTTKTTATGTVTGQTTYTADVSKGLLDSVYPQFPTKNLVPPQAQPNPNTTDFDSPRILLGSGAFPTAAELSESFTARSWLMWDPALRFDGASCQPAFREDTSTVEHPSTCDSIPIPLGYVEWHWSGDAIDTLDTAHTPANTLGWKAAGPGCATPNTAQAGPGLTPQPFTLPEWGGVIKASGFPGNLTCQGVACTP